MSADDLDARSPGPSSADPAPDAPAATAPELASGENDLWSLLVSVAYEERRRLALHVLARRFVPDDAAAHDLLHDAMVRVHACPPRSRTEDAVAACLFTTVERLRLNEVRRRSCGPELRDLTDEANEPGAAGPDVVVRLSLQESVLALEAALQRLSPRQRDVVRLTRREGLSRAEAASRLGVTEESVKRSLARAAAKLGPWASRLG